MKKKPTEQQPFASMIIKIDTTLTSDKTLVRSLTWSEHHPEQETNRKEKKR